MLNLFQQQKFKVYKNSFQNSSSSANYMEQGEVKGCLDYNSKQLKKEYPDLTSKDVILYLPCEDKSDYIYFSAAVNSLYIHMDDLVSCKITHAGKFSEGHGGPSSNPPDVAFYVKSVTKHVGILDELSHFAVLLSHSQ